MKKRTKEMFSLNRRFGSTATTFKAWIERGQIEAAAQFLVERDGGDAATWDARIRHSLDRVLRDHREDILKGQFGFVVSKSFVTIVLEGEPYEAGEEPEVQVSVLVNPNRASTDDLRIDDYITGEPAQTEEEIEAEERELEERLRAEGRIDENGEYIWPPEVLEKLEQMRASGAWSR